MDNVRKLGHTSLMSSSSDLESAGGIPLSSETPLVQSFGKRWDKRR